MSESIQPQGERRTRSAAPRGRRSALGDTARPSFAGMRLVRIERFESAVPLSSEEREPYIRRYSTVFVDESQSRRGGIGQISFALNAEGEPLAIKTLVRPTRGAGEEQTPYDARLNTLRRLFRQEYESQRALNGMRGFPQLFGYGFVGESPAIVMEWIEGVTLEEARHRLAVDDAGRLSPLVVARLGRDLFQLLDLLERVGEGLVHRDLSPANIMIRTNHLSVEKQAVEGSFDLCLIDFGSAVEVGDSAGTSLTASEGVARAATADYAPPEMLTRDLPHLDRLRKSPTIDVYAAASVLYQLLSGEVPFELGGASDVSPYRTKVDGEPARPACAHAEGCDLERVLSSEPEVSALVGAALLDMQPLPSEEGVRQALALVDDQLADLVMSCIRAKQDERPSAEALQQALATFCSCYAQNVGRALAGEPLLPCTANSSWYASASPVALRRMIRSVGTAVAAGVWLVVVVATGILLQGVSASFWFSGTQRVELTAPVVSLTLALPTVAALAARGRYGAERSGFLRGSVVLAATSVTLGLFAASGSFDNPGRVQGVLAAVFASAAAGWCPLVLDYATTVVPALLREKRRLPSGSDRAALNLIGSSAAKAPELGAATGMEDATYEVPHDAAKK